MRIAFIRDFIEKADEIDLVLRPEYLDTDVSTGKMVTHPRVIRTIRNPHDRIEFVTQVVFVAKRFIPHFHENWIIFRKGTNQMEFTLCERCFDVRDNLTPPATVDKKVLLFEMPKGMWAVFSRYGKEYHDSLPRSEQGVRR